MVSDSPPVETDAVSAEIEQIKRVETLNEMRKELFRMSYHSPIVRATFDAANHAGLSGEDRYAMLAYNLLDRLCQLEEHLMVDFCLRPHSVVAPRDLTKEDLK